MKSFFLSCIIVSCTFSLSGQEVVTKDYSAYILTPPAPKAPRINGATGKIGADTHVIDASQRHQVINDLYKIFEGGGIAAG